MKKIFTFIPVFCLFSFIGTLTAQNPYESLGEEATVLTLSNGLYQEHFPNKTIVDIGGVRLNTATGKVVGLLDVETETESLDPTVSTRFLSVDPIARSYPMLTPYQFASNTPVIAIDLDGLEAITIHQLRGLNNYTGTRIETVYSIDLNGNPYYKIQGEFTSENSDVSILLDEAPNQNVSYRDQIRNSGGLITITHVFNGTNINSTTFYSKWKNGWFLV